ncbi:MAG: DUF4249 family protein [Cytophagales bacterium]|nr:DUF4249 family protein [Cytophagales bacterium]
MSKLNGYIAISILMCLSSACVELIELENPREFPKELVVEGSINDLDDSFRIQLRTTSSTRGVGSNTLGQGAWVRVISATDTVEFHETSPGIYDSDPEALVVERGKSYSLYVVTNSDQHYQSSPVTLPEPIPTGASFAERVDTGRADEFGVFRQSWAHRIFVTLENSDVIQYYKIDMESWREKRVSYTAPVDAPSICWAFDPLAVRSITIGTNEGLAEGSYLVEAAAIRATIREKYIAQPRVSSMSEAAYRFWLAARTQLDRDRGVFVEPFANIVGNMRNVNDEEEIVHGYFHAYSQTQSRTCFDTFDLPLRQLLNNFGAPCAEVFAPAVYNLPFEDELCNE